MNKKQQGVSQVICSIHPVCVLTTMWPAISHLHSHVFSTLRDCILSDQKPKCPSLPSDALVSCLSQQQENNEYIMQTFRTF